MRQLKALDSGQSLLAGIIAFAALFNPAQATEKWQTFLTIDSLNYSEPVTIGDNFRDWKGAELRSGESIYTKSVVTMGAGKAWQKGLTQWGLTSQYHYYLDFSQDTARWHHHDKNNRDTPLKGLFNIDLLANHFRGNGLFLSHTYHHNNWSFGGRLTYLKTYDLLLGRASGTYDPSPVDAVENQTQITVDYAYREERILDRQVEPTDGQGWLAGLTARWENTHHLFGIEADNAWSRLRWGNAPGSLIEGDLADLRNRTDAAIKFREYYLDLTQTLPQHFKAQYYYHTNSPIKNRLGDYALGMGFHAEKIDNISWTRIEIGLTSQKKDKQLKFSWAPESQALGIHLKGKYGEIYWEADDIDAFEAHVFNVGVALHYYW